jgi:hypothetical protein
MSLAALRPNPGSESTNLRTPPLDLALLTLAMAAPPLPLPVIVTMGAV